MEPEKKLRVYTDEMLEDYSIEELKNKLFIVQTSDVLTREEIQLNVEILNRHLGIVDDSVISIAQKMIAEQEPEYDITG